MNHRMRHTLGAAAGCLILVAASAQSESTAQEITPRRPNARPAYGPSNILPMQPLPAHPGPNANRPIGGDWRRAYPWRPYNAWRNPYWYPPYSPYNPYPPVDVYPYYPVPQPYPWGGIGSINW